MMSNSLKSILTSISIAFFMFSGCASTSPALKMSASGKSRIDLYAIYQDGCPACAMMKQSMKDPRVQELLSREFTVHISDISDKESLPKAWMRPVYTPTLYFLDSNQKELISSTDKAMSPDRLLMTLKSAVEARDLE